MSLCFSQIDKGIMTINKVHCFFEQSGTFKNQWKALGYEAFDYDLQNNFGETDYVMDLFAEIDNAYDHKPSLFDSIQKDDLIMAFYPCIYFSAMSQFSFYLACRNYRLLSDRRKIEQILIRSERRQEFYNRLIKFVGVVLERGLRMILENPWNEQTYLKANFLKAPDLVDFDRSLRGDYRKKPTAYWFWNCEPKDGFTYDQWGGELKLHMTSKKSAEAGLCSEERSMISPTYARNFICDFILGKPQKNSQLNLFNEEFGF